jgi:Tol biopolymer transport system component
MYIEKGIGQTFVKALARDDAPVRVTKLTNFSAPFSFSPDATTLLMGTQHPSTQWDLYSAPAQAGAEMKPLVVTPYTESRARFSPDGKWFVYDSTESGRSEVYVRRFPPTVDQWQISTEGGSSPFWSADGQELYYVGTDSLMAVPISGGDRLNPGTARALFPVPSNWRAGALLTSGPLGSMVCGVTPDGTRFLFQSTENDRLAPINVIVGGTSLFGAK